MSFQLTHVIIDEVHEREMYSDFLLSVMRDIIPLRRYLQLILMTADSNPLELQVLRCTLNSLHYTLQCALVYNIHYTMYIV